MIEIKANGRKLTLYSNTTLTLEANSTLFSSPDVEGDFSYPFELPIDGNETALDFAHLPWRAGRCRIPCTLSAGGVLNIKGELLLQKAESKSLTAAVIVTPYPEGFGKRKLTENTDEEIIVGHHPDTHKEEWRDFLKNSLDPEADIKFAPFFNDDGYGSENEDFGNWNGMKVLSVANPVFTDGQGELLQISFPFLARTECEKFTLKDNNDSEMKYWERNQLAMCPQIRMSRLLETWCNNAGYKLKDNLGTDLKDTFIQSTRSLDGTQAQYMQDGTEIKTDATVLISGHYDNIPVAHYFLNSHGQHVANGAVTLPQTGWWQMTIKGSFQWPSSYTGIDTANWSKWAKLAMAIATSGSFLPVGGMDLTALVLTYLGSSQYTFRNVNFTVALFERRNTELTLQQIDEEEGVVWKKEFTAAAAAVFEMTTNIRITQATAGLPLELIAYVKADGTHNGGTRYWPLNAELDMIRFKHRSSEPQPGGLNIWRKSFNIPELCPDTTNSALLKTVIDTFGMCHFASKAKECAEFVPYALIRNAKAIDLTEYELIKETETAEPEKPTRTFRLKPLKEESYAEKQRLPNVNKEKNMPEPEDCAGRTILCEETNTLYKSEAVESGEDNWTAKWQELSGNPDKLEAKGEDTGEESLEPATAVPHMRWWMRDNNTGETYHHGVANFTIGSDMYNPDERNSELIITQYRGAETIEHERRVIPLVAAYEAFTSVHDVMLPVYGKQFSLTAIGENSLGEKYIKPVLELKNNKELTYKLRVPYALMPAIDNLLRPQEENPQNQTRFIIIRNVRSIPKKITFQIENKDISGTVLCQIESVRT